MSKDPDVNDVAGALRVSMGLLVRRLRQAKAEGELTPPESSALARLNRGGPATSATLAGLEARGLAGRGSDPEDGRRVVISLTEAGLQALQDRRNAGTELLAQALSTGFTRSELEQLLAVVPLIERLAES